MNDLIKANSSNEEIMMGKIVIPESQKKIYLDSVNKMILISARLSSLEAKSRKLKTEIAEDSKTRELKELKRKIKVLTETRSQTQTACNASLEMALAEVPGNNLDEKIQYLGAK